MALLGGGEGNGWISIVNWSCSRLGSLLSILGKG